MQGIYRLFLKLVAGISAGVVADSMKADQTGRFFGAFAATIGFYAALEFIESMVKHRNAL
jgi:hypothetical protein